MRRRNPLAFVALVFVLARGERLHAQPASDSTAIRTAALDYIEGWYGGNGDRMARALHPELVKRILMRDPAGTSWIRGMGRTELVRGTRAGGGTGVPVQSRRTEVRILDIFQNAASVRIDAGGWIDYLHLVRWADQWLILNVLWENRQSAAAPSDSIAERRTQLDRLLQTYRADSTRNLKGVVVQQHGRRLGER